MLFFARLCMKVYFLNVSVNVIRFTYLYFITESSGSRHIQKSAACLFSSAFYLVISELLDFRCLLFILYHYAV